MQAMIAGTVAAGTAVTAIAIVLKVLVAPGRMRGVVICLIRRQRVSRHCMRMRVLDWHMLCMHSLRYNLMRLAVARGGPAVVDHGHRYHGAQRKHQQREGKKTGDALFKMRDHGLLIADKGTAYNDLMETDSAPVRDADQHLPDGFSMHESYEEASERADGDCSRPM
jgi:hypothetical protein